MQSMLKAHVQFTVFYCLFILSTLSCFLFTPLSRSICRRVPNFHLPVILGWRSVLCLLLSHPHPRLARINHVYLWVFLALCSSIWNLFYLTFCSQWTYDVVLTKDYKYLEVKNNFSFQFASSVAQSIWHIVDTQQMLMTSPRIADVPDIQLTSTTNFISEFISNGKWHSLIICSVGIQRCTMLLSQWGALERWQLCFVVYY